MLWRCQSSILTLTLMLMACQTPHLPSKGTGNYSDTSLRQRTPSQRTCWQKVPPPHLGGASETFILAAGANTGDLINLAIQN